MKRRIPIFLMMQILSIVILAALFLLLPDWYGLIPLALLAARAAVFVSPVGVDKKEEPPGEKQALVVVDMQQALCGDEQLYPDGYALIDAVNREIEKAKQRGDAIFYLRQDFAPWDPLGWLAFGGRLLRGTEGVQLVIGLDMSGGPQFVKSRQDGFSSPGFRQALAKHGVGAVTVVGLDASACVLRTAQGAKRRGMAVSIPRTAVQSKKQAAKDGALRTAAYEGIEVV